MPRRAEGGARASPACSISCSSSIPRRWSRRRTRPRSRCSTMQLDPSGDRGGRAADRARRARLDQRRSAGAGARAASAGRSGSSPDSRPQGAAGAAAPGCRSPAISTPACCSTAPAPPEQWPRIVVRRGARRRTMRSLAVAPDARAAARAEMAERLLLDGAKFAGILLEGRERARRLAVAVGIGVNCAHHPPTRDYPATDLAAAGAGVARRSACSARCRARCWAAGAMERAASGFAAIRADWLARAAGLGDARSACASPTSELAGRFEALDERGPPDAALARRQRCETIAAGDVLSALRRPPTSGDRPLMAARATNSCSRRSAASARSA